MTLSGYLSLYSEQSIRFYILLTVHHVMILDKWPTWRTIFSMCLFLFLPLYMFRAHSAHHQERQIVSIQPLVAVTLCQWPCRVQVGSERSSYLLMMMLCYGMREISFTCNEGGKKWTQLHALYEALFAFKKFKMHCKIMDLWYYMWQI
jgi:hypothetical protein